MLDIRAVINQEIWCRIVGFQNPFLLWILLPFLSIYSLMMGDVHSVCGGNDNFVSFFILSKIRLLFPTSERRLYAWHSYFPHTAALFCSRLFVAVVAKKSTPNVKFRSHFNSDLPPCEWANFGRVASSDTGTAVILAWKPEAVFIPIIPCLMEVK